MALFHENCGRVWKGLTGGQRSAWWDFAMDHPWYGWFGQVKIINGWQMFIYINTQLAVANFFPLVKDPPLDLTRPDPIYLPVTLWPVKSKLASGQSRFHGRILINVETPIPQNRLIVFYQRWERYKYCYTTPTKACSYSLIPPPPNTSGISRDSFNPQRAGILLPGFSGQYDLASYGGRPISDGQRSDNIKGNWARIKPDWPLGWYRVVNTENGFWTQVPLQTAA